MYAILVGSISLTCLLAAIVTDSWIHTEDVVNSVPPFAPFISGGYTMEASHTPIKIEFTIGLWKVCPKIIRNEKWDLIRSTSLSTNVQEGKHALK